MENNIFSIDRKSRELSGSGIRIYRIIFGLIILIIGLSRIITSGLSVLSSNNIYSTLFILSGIIIIVIGLSGKEPFKVRYRLMMNTDLLKVRKGFSDEVVIDLNSITYLKILPFKLEISFGDYMKTYDFSWMTTNEFEDFRIRITDYCLKKNIEIEN